MNGPTPIHQIIPRIAKQYSLGQNVDASFLLLQYDRITEALLGRPHATKGSFIKNGILFAYVTSPIVGQEIMVHKHAILRKLQEYRSEIVLKTIITKQQRSLGVAKTPEQ